MRDLSKPEEPEIELRVAFSVVEAEEIITVLDYYAYDNSVISLIGILKEKVNEVRTKRGD